VARPHGLGLQHAGEALAVEHAEVDQVQVDRVGIHGGVVELPDLGAAVGDGLGDRVGVQEGAETGAGRVAGRRIDGAEHGLQAAVGVGAFESISLRTGW
jgi:hypothetical protein